MGGQAKARRTNPLTTTRARLDFQPAATDNRVCPNQQRRTASACSICASLPLSLPTKAVHTMVFQGTLTPSIPPSIHPARISSQPSRLPKHRPRPRNSQPPPLMAISNGVCLLLSLYCLGQRTTMRPVPSTGFWRKSRYLTVPC